MADSPSRSEVFGPFRTVGARLDDLEARLLAVGTPSEEDIAEAVNEYLTLNPVEAIPEVVPVIAAFSPDRIVNDFGGTFEASVEFSSAFLGGLVPSGTKVLVWAGGSASEIDGAGFYTKAAGNTFTYDAEQPAPDPLTLFYVYTDVSFIGSNSVMSLYILSEGGYAPVGGSAFTALLSSVLVADSAISFDLDGIFDPTEPNATPLGRRIALINQVEPDWNGVWVGTTTDFMDPGTYTPMRRVRGLPPGASAVLAVDSLAQNPGELATFPNGGWLLSYPADMTTPGQNLTGEWRIVISPSTVDLSGYVTFDDVTNFVVTTDERLSDDRNPTGHASSHLPGGSDALFSPRFRVIELPGGNEFDPGESAFYTLTLSPLFAIAQVRCAEMDARFRLYTDPDRRAADEARPFNTPPAADSGLILDVICDASDKVDLTPAVIGFSAGQGLDLIPNGSSLYLTVTSENGVTVEPATAGLIVWVNLHDGLDGTPLTSPADAS